MVGGVFADMNDPAEQLEMLLSRRADGDLTPEEEARVRRAIEAAADAERDAGRYERLGEMLANYRRLPRLDWGDLAREVGERVRAANAAAEGEAPLDAALASWAGPLPDVDWAALKVRVSMAVRRAAEADARAARARSWRPTRAWLGPIAVAAAVVLAVFWPRKIEEPEFPIGKEGAMYLVELDVPAPGQPISISFDRTSPPSVGDSDPQASVSAIAFGPSEPAGDEYWEEAYLY